MRSPVIVLTAAVLLAALMPAAAAQDDAFVRFKVMKPEIALKLARATLERCRTEGAQVAVAVVDRAGVVQVMLRDRFAGPHTLETARRKAWTAVSFRSDTLALSALMKPGAANFGANFVPGALMLGGGVPVEAGGELVGGVGVSGAPSGQLDDACSRAGIEAVADDLAF